MILYRSPLIYGTIKRIVQVFFTVIYKIFNFLNMQFTLLLALIGLVLYLTGAFSSNNVVLIIYYLLLVLSIVYAIVATIKKLLGLSPRVKKSKGAHIIDQQIETIKAEKHEPIKEERVVERPTYYTVKQNNNFIMAEYSDRYELYKKTEDGLKKVRTDFK